LEGTIEEKNSGEKVNYLHPNIEQYTRNTFGIFVYKEQIIQILADICGFSWTGAELLRRLMNKKKLQENLE
jgi:DNA polymerase-3 subunit alpha